MQGDDENGRQFPPHGRLLVTAIAMAATIAVIIVSVTAPAQLAAALSGLAVLAAALTSSAGSGRR